MKKTLAANMKKFILIISLIITLSPVIALAQDEPTDLGASLPKITNPLNNPKLSVKIPSLAGLRSVKCETTAEGETCYIPWLADYIDGLYRYGIGALVILAVVTMMVGGIVWLTAAGNEKRISDAKNWINGSLFGVLIALSSYMILIIVNPALVELSPIKIKTISRIDMEPLTLSPEEIDAPPPNGGTTSGRGETHCGCPWDIQGDYKHVKFPPNGNVANHGCGAVSSWDLVKCKNKNYTLESWISVMQKNGITAGEGGSYGGSMYKAFKDAGLQAITFEGSKALTEAAKKISEIKDKNPMMVIGVRGVNKGGTANCQFTRNGHFIFGVKIEGTSICINDPNNRAGYDSKKNAEIKQIERDCLVTSVTVVW